MEVWKDVKGYEGLYEVSSKGRVRTKEGKTTYRILNGRKQKRVWKSRVLKEKNPSGRDVRVSLWKNRKEKSWLVHRLVAMAFLPNTDNKPSINHIDGNPRNNNVENLEWVTYKENSNHAFDNDLMRNNVKVVLQCSETDELFSFRSMAKASEFMGRNPGYVSGQLIKGKAMVNSVKNRKFLVYLPTTHLVESG